MSSRSRRPGSLGLRLVLSFMASSFTVVLVTTAIQFWTYQHRVRALNDDLLQSRVQEVSRAIAQRPYDSLAMSEEMVWGGAAATGARIWLRVTDAQGLLGETPGMAELMPRSWFGGRTTRPPGRAHLHPHRSTSTAGSASRRAWTPPRPSRCWWATCRSCW